MTQLELKVEVQNAENLTAMDFVIIDVTVRRANLKPEEEVSYVHSNTYPFLKRETIHLMITDTESERQIISFQKLDFQGHETTVQMKIRFAMLGRIPITIYAISDSYYQVVEKANIVLAIQQKPKEPTKEEMKGVEMFKYHEDDLNTGMSLFEQMMKGVKEEENSDDDEEDEQGNFI